MSIHVFFYLCLWFSFVFLILYAIHFGPTSLYQVLDQLHESVFPLHCFKAIFLEKSELCTPNPGARNFPVNELIMYCVHRVLTVHGSADEIIPVEDALEFDKIIPNHKLHIIEGANHSYTSHQAELASVVLPFIKDGLQQSKYT